MESFYNFRYNNTHINWLWLGSFRDICKIKLTHVVAFIDLYTGVIQNCHNSFKLAIGDQMESTIIFRKLVDDITYTVENRSSTLLVKYILKLSKA